MRLAGLLLAGGGAAWLAQAQGAQMALLWLLGAGLGLVLFLSSFSFAGGFRRLLSERRSAGFRAMLLLLGLACLLSLPAIEAGSLWGQAVRGFVFPIGWALLLGALLFGIGMQLGGGCASGTLYTAAGGQGARMWLTLAAFIAGATFAAYDAERWSGWAALPPVSLPRSLGLPGALALSLGALALAWAVAAWLERRQHGTLEPLTWRGSLWRYPWPPLWGALGLALLGFATLLLAGRPWAITAAFPLWGSRAIEALGLDDPAFWPYWEDPTRTEALLRPLLADRMTVMDFGLMAGAFLAATLAGRRGDWRLPRPGPALASLLGGLLLGYGAIIAFGCNISAFLGGILSGSLHGWVWIIPALGGNALGARLRPYFGLDQPAPR